MKRLAVAMFVVLLAGCLGGKGAPPVTYFVMTDLGKSAASVPGPSIARTLVVAAGADDAFYDAENLVYSRVPGSRAYYQFAAWTDRPSRRVAALTERRLEDRGRFASVAAITAGVNADLLLNVNLAELYHDVTVKPAMVRIRFIGEIVDWKARVLVGRRSFAVAVPVASADAKSAVDAINDGVTLILDQLVPWVESTGAKTLADQ